METEITESSEIEETEIIESSEVEESETIETVESNEDTDNVDNSKSSEIIYNIESIDYSTQLESLTSQVEYLTTVNTQTLYSLNFMLSCFISVFICFILYKVLKIFF